MNCEQANQIDLVDYLHVLGFTPQKIIRGDHLGFGRRNKNCNCI